LYLKGSVDAKRNIHLTEKMNYRKYVGLNPKRNVFFDMEKKNEVQRLSAPNNIIQRK
jgi:hypothetical protein